MKNVSNLAKNLQYKEASKIISLKKLTRNRGLLQTVKAVDWNRRILSKLQSKTIQSQTTIFHYNLHHLVGISWENIPSYVLVEHKIHCDTVILHYCSLLTLEMVQCSETLKIIFKVQHTIKPKYKIQLNQQL